MGEAGESHIPTASAETISTIRVVGRYEILREVGRGGMATVYLARQTDLDRFVALKQLNALHDSDASFARRFLRESRVAGSLSHPNIVTVHDYFEHDGTPYIAMEYLDRGSLRPYVGHMNLAQIGGVLEGLLAGLSHAESHGIVHRDLKPENLMVTADGRVKIADFGIAKATTKMQTAALTATGMTVGTPRYMAPEQAMAHDIGPWTDLYSVGCMAFELFTGSVPFHDSDAPMAILLRHVNEPIAPVKSIRPEVDQRISDWIEKLLVKEPAQRTQNAQDAWDEFEEILLGLLGPRWRREARLVERVDVEADGAKPLTPAPFAGTSADVGSAEVMVEESGFATFGAPAPPPPDDVVGETGFVTFGAPAPPPPTDALILPPPPPEALAPTDVSPTPAPVEAAPSSPVEVVNVAPEEVAPSSPGEVAYAAPPEPAESFETYVAPPPSRPPTDVPAFTPPPVESVAPAPALPTPAPAPEPVARAPEPVAATMMPHSLSATPANAPVAEQPTGRRWVVPVAIGSGVVVIAVAAAIVLRSGNDKTHSPETPTVTPAAAIRVSASGITLKVPAGWGDTGDLPQVPGFAAGAVSLGGPKGGAVVVGRGDSTAANSTLLASDLRAAVGTLPEKTVADLGDGVQAARYAKLSLGGGETATVYAVPTTAGVATLACTADDKTCDSIAASMRISDGDTFAVGPSPAYSEDIDGALSKLEKQEKSAAAALRNAGKRSSQAAATAQLASAYTGAARTLSKLKVSPADTLLNRQLVDALRATGSAYNKAAGEARRKDRGGYAREGKAALAAGKELEQRVNGLTAADYELPASLLRGAGTVTRLPTLIKDLASPSPVPTRQPTPAPTRSPAPVPTQTAAPAPTRTAAPAPTSDGGGEG